MATSYLMCMQCNAMLKYSTINKLKRRFWMQNYEFGMNSSVVDTNEWIWIYCDNFLRKLHGQKFNDNKFYLRLADFHSLIYR